MSEDFYQIGTTDKLELQKIYWSTIIFMKLTPTDLGQLINVRINF